MAAKTESTIRRATADDLAVGLICADRDGNRIRIDHLDHTNQTLSYHFLNDELREELITRGRRQAARFSWARTAREVLTVYEEAAPLSV